MTTIILERPGMLAYAADTQPRDPGPGEALVRVRAVGVCGTDFHAFTGKQPFFAYPRILGHEVGVEVVAMGPAPATGASPARAEGVHGIAVGDHCAVEPYIDCGTCIACRRGKSNCCERISVLGVHADGGMRDVYIVPTRKLHRSGSLSFAQLALVETLGIGAHAVARAQILREDTVLVVGAGPIGLSAIQFARASGARVVAMDANDDRLAFCRRFGVAETVRPGATREETEARLRATFGGDLPTAVLDATGNAGSMASSFRYACNGGRLVFVGLFQGELSFDDPDFHKRELTVMGSRNSTAADFAAIIPQLESGAIDTQPWITHRAPAARAAEAFPEWMDPHSRCLKAIIDW